jgi:hypothetical protein
LSKRMSYLGGPDTCTNHIPSNLASLFAKGLISSVNLSPGACISILMLRSNMSLFILLACGALDALYNNLV